MGVLDGGELAVLGPTTLLIAPSRLGTAMFNFDHVTLFDVRTGVFEKLLLKQFVPNTLPARDESRFEHRDASLLGQGLFIVCTQIVPFGPDDDPETYMGFNGGVEWAVYLYVDLRSRQTVKSWRTKITESQEFKLQVASGMLVEETNQPPSLTLYVPDTDSDCDLKQILILPGQTYKPTLGLLRVEQRGLTVVSEGGKTSFFSDTPLLDGEAVDISPSLPPDDKLRRKATSIAEGAGLWNNKHSAYRFKLRRRIDSFIRGSVSPDGAYIHLVHGYTNSVVKTATFEVVTVSTSDMTYIESEFADDCRWLFIADNKYTVLVFDLALGQTRHRHRFPEGIQSMLSLSESHFATVKKFFHEKSAVAYGRVDIQRTDFRQNVFPTAIRTITAYHKPIHTRTERCKTETKRRRRTDTSHRVCSGDTTRRKAKRRNTKCSQNSGR